MRKITKFQSLWPILSQNSKESARGKSQNFQFLPLTTLLLFAETAKGIAQHFALNC